MEQIFQQEIVISPSLCDVSGRLSIPDAFAICMDIAAAHADALGCGLHDLARRDLFWVTVKTHLQFFDRPRMMERVMLRTWPEAPGKLRGNRSYQLLRGDTVLLAGKTEWAIMHLQKMQPDLLISVYPDALRFETPSASPAPFARIADDFDGCAPLAHYTVRSTDIDVGGHMNNTAYIRAILSCFSNREIYEMRIGAMDVIFRSPCFEGDTLTLQKKDLENETDLRLSKDSGVTALLARIERAP